MTDWQQRTRMSVQIRKRKGLAESLDVGRTGPVRSLFALKLKRVLDLNAKETHGALDFGVTQQDDPIFEIGKREGAAGHLFLVSAASGERDSYLWALGNLVGAAC